jgi:hypothetical protein
VFSKVAGIFISPYENEESYIVDERKCKMQKSNRKEAWKSSLAAMKKSLVNTYELGTSASEEERFANAWLSGGPDYVVFSDYRRNEGRRRILDVADIIDNAIERILNSTNEQTAAHVYLDTLRAVILYTNWARVLENSVSTRYVM